MPMNLLISNDDGIFSPGIRALADGLAAAGHQVSVVAPDRERSATGHGLTLHEPIRAEMIESVFHPRVKAWTCSGTPADCVKLALGALVEEPPDLVISGINQGANLGTDILYSGTVSAAMEGTIEGISAVAISLASFCDRNFEPAAKLAQILVNRLQGLALDPSILLNVNVPAGAIGDMQGFQVTRQGIRRYFDQFERRVDPRGKVYYWLAGEVVQEIEDSPHPEWPEAVAAAVKAMPTDVAALQQGYISLTPLQYNLTSVGGLSALQNWAGCSDQLLKLLTANMDVGL